VAEEVVDGIRADRFWMLPASEHSDRQIRARSLSTSLKSGPGSVS
ncbi:alcohol dehydrogenase, partial [Streptomyces hundungensis]